MVTYNPAVSIFEDHTVIIDKNGQDTPFGHKMFLTAGKSDLNLDSDCQRQPRLLSPTTGGDEISRLKQQKKKLTPNLFRK